MHECRAAEWMSPLVGWSGRASAPASERKLGNATRQRRHAMSRNRKTAASSVIQPPTKSPLQAHRAIRAGGRSCRRQTPLPRSQNRPRRTAILYLDGHRHCWCIDPEHVEKSCSGVECVHPSIAAADKGYVQSRIILALWLRLPNNGACNGFPTATASVKNGFHPGLESKCRPLTMPIAESGHQPDPQPMRNLPRPFAFSN
jgi:hypothetical protein